MTVAWSSNETDNTYAVAWGDYDGDGKLDLAVGNYVNRTGYIATTATVR